MTGNVLSASDRQEIQAGASTLTSLIGAVAGIVGGNNPRPAPVAPATPSVPAPQTGGISQKTLMIGGGIVAVILILIFAFRGK